MPEGRFKSASSASLMIEIFNSIFYRMSKRLVGFSDGIEKKFSPRNSLLMDNSQLDYAIDLLPENEATMEEKQILKGIRKFSPGKRVRLNLPRRSTIQAFC